MGGRRQTRRTPDWGAWIRVYSKRREGHGNEKVLVSKPMERLTRIFPVAASGGSHLVRVFRSDSWSGQAPIRAHEKARFRYETGCLIGGDGGELNPPSRGRTPWIYYKLSWAFDLALARRPSRLALGTTGNLRRYLPA